jgi:hypothetical protein
MWCTKIATQTFQIYCRIWMTLGIRDMHNMLSIFGSFLKTGAWETVIFLQAQMYLHLHIPQSIWFFKVMNATSECNIFNPDLLKIIEINVSSVHRLHMFMY